MHLMRFKYLRSTFNRSILKTLTLTSLVLPVTLSLSENASALDHLNSQDNIETTSLSLSTFNIRFFGIGGDYNGSPNDEWRDGNITAHLAKHDMYSDVMVFQEILDVRRLQNLLPAGFHCKSYEAERDHQHVVICLRRGLTLEVAPGDDNFMIEEIMLGRLRPAVHGVVKDEQGKSLVHVLAVHLKAMPNESATRLKQVKILANYLRQNTGDTPVAILGDFNTFNDDVEDFSRYFGDRRIGMEHVDLGETNTYRTLRHASQLDHIWMSSSVRLTGEPEVAGPCNLPDSEFRRIEKYNKMVSDHCPLKIQVQIK